MASHNTPSKPALYYYLIVQNQYLRKNLVASNETFANDVHRQLRQTIECLVVVKEIEYAQDDPNPGPDSEIECELRNGRILRLTNLENLPPAIRNRLESGVDRLTIPRALVTRTSIQIPRNAAVRREKLGKWFRRQKQRGQNGNDNLFDKDDNVFDSGGERHLQVIPTVGVTRSVLVVRTRTTDSVVTATVAELSDAVFGTSGDPVNLSSQFDACSFGSMKFEPVTGLASVVNGAIEVTVTNSTSDGDVKVSNDVAQTLARTFNVESASELADHIMICLPGGTMTSIAYANINSWRSVYSDEWCSSVSAQMHELGKDVSYRSMVSRPAILARSLLSFYLPLFP